MTEKLLKQQMAEIIVCDTNAVIHLAIIWPSCLTTAHPNFKLVIYATVRAEVTQLKMDSEKNARIGDILSFISDCSTTPGYALPSKQQEVQMHGRIKTIEDGLPPEEVSAGSSHNDRVFLILAKHNKTKLLTNERTLYNLGRRMLGHENVLKTSDVLELLLSTDTATKDDIQKGLITLKSHGESLGQDCANKIRAIGFKY